MWTLKLLSKPRELRRAYRRVFMTEEGQLVLADLAERFCVTRPIYGDGMTTERAMVNEGQRQAVLHILNTLNLNPDTLPKEYTNG
ncbi:hypothetical protein [Pseudodesulfovibrio pelocollis]|uniref:Bbp19 family protein n=1 Tax=Pseudodesulfovibrio pelocollis TaxID=3051432 RepID=UPI00255B0394|nr:hypothetical protein [Pseudodesulfovibrio sp. SB368]